MERRPFLVGLIGTGVTPSLTPPMHMREAAQHGVGYVYRPIDLTVLGLSGEAVGELLPQAQRLGYDAFNITHPCKQLVIPHLDRLDPTAERLGAVNTVLFENGEAVGYNTDTTGFASAMRTGLPGAALRDVIQFGAGGAGTAVADALLSLGVEHLVLADPDTHRGTDLAHSLAARFPQARVEAIHPDKAETVLPEADGLVNCTPMGMADHPGTSVDTDLLRPELWVADIVYRPIETALLTAARATGCRTLHGGHMAVHQAVDAFRLITGLEPDADRMLEHLHELTALEG